MKKKVTVDLPAWLPMEEWAAYVEMRKTIKKPLTEYAIKLALGQLERLKAAGHAPAAVLNQSTFNSYQGLFPVKVIHGLEAPTVPKGQCPVCGGGRRQVERGWECKKCGRISATRDEA